MCAEDASSLLSNQEKSRRQGQSEIVEDLTRVRENIQEVWRRVGESAVANTKVYLCGEWPGIMENANI